MSFKYGYMAQEAPFFSNAGANGREPTGAKKREQCCLTGQPTPTSEKTFGQVQRRTLEMLDSPASCDQVDDGNNQSDDQ